MKVEKEILMEQIPGLYAVGEILLDKELYYAAASENRGGGLYLVHSMTKEISELQGCQGGVMAVLGAAQERAILCIEEFYPVFDSAGAKIVKAELERTGKGWAASRRKTVAEVPYVHRIAQLTEEDGNFIAAGKLCKHKDCSDDWSTAGSMEIGRYEPEEGVSSFERVRDGIYKHHAMFIRKNESGYDDLYYGGSEGAFVTTRKNGTWETRQILDVPVSDIVCYDLDGDGMDEIAIIEGFHGDKAVIFKQGAGGYERALELPLDFGHVLWGGSFLGGPGLITGSRGGGMQLSLYRFNPNREEENRLSVRSETVIDKGQAPAQIIVNEWKDSAEIIAANHGGAQLVRYRCSL